MCADGLDRVGVEGLARLAVGDSALNLGRKGGT